MTGLGVVSLCVDPDANTSIGMDMVIALKALHVSDVQVSLRGDRANVIPIDLYKEKFALLAGNGINVHVRLDDDFNRPWLEGNSKRMFYPNSALGYRGNKRHNQWIVDTCTRAYRVVRALGQSVTSWGVYNEPNLALTGTMRPVHIGENVPPVTDDKAPALAAEVFYSLCYECAGWLRSGGAMLVYTGSLSWLPIGSAADIGWIGNVYTAGYMHTGLRYLADSGVKQWPWDGVSLNCEGIWTSDKAQAMQRAVIAVLAQHGLTLPIVIGEWGYKPGSTLDTAKATGTYQALASIAARLHFYQAQLVDGWGAFGWSVAAQTMVPTAERSAWYPVLQQLMTPATATP